MQANQQWEFERNFTIKNRLNGLCLSITKLKNKSLVLVCKTYIPEYNEHESETQLQQQEKRKSIKIKFAQLWKWKMHGQLCSKIIRNAAVHLNNTKPGQQVLIYDSQAPNDNYYEEWELIPVLEK